MRSVFLGYIYIYNFTAKLQTKYVALDQLCACSCIDKTLATPQHRTVELEINSEDVYVS